jgi:hypothetical protein
MQQYIVDSTAQKHRISVLRASHSSVYDSVFSCSSFHDSNIVAIYDSTAHVSENVFKSLDSVFQDLVFIYLGYGVDRPTKNMFVLFTIQVVIFPDPLSESVPV